MPQLKNPSHELMVIERCGGLSELDAYLKVYPKATERSKESQIRAAKRIFNRPKVVDRIRELQTPRLQAVAHEALSFFGTLKDIVDGYQDGVSLPELLKSVRDFQAKFTGDNPESAPDPQMVYKCLQLQIQIANIEQNRKSVAIQALCRALMLPARQAQRGDPDPVDASPRRVPAAWSHGPAQPQLPGPTTAQPDTDTGDSASQGPVSATPEGS